MQTENGAFERLSMQVIGEVRKVIVGKDETLLWTLAALLAGGHILLEDIPGMGKTTMAVTFSKVLGLSCNRMQFTPDVLPSDVTGYTMPDAATGKMLYQPGAVLCNLFLADELNRATSRTQSALLEAMEEGQVTVDGVCHPIPKPFMVIATQNPTGAAGTQLLPDSQMDRFSVRMQLGYPKPADEVNMVLNRQGKNPLETVEQVLTRQQLLDMQRMTEETYVDKQVVEYIVRLISETRNHRSLLRGASPRATLSVTAMAKAAARLKGRDYVVPKDVMEVFIRTVEHRLLLTAQAEGNGETGRTILSEILRTVTAPKLG